MVNVLIDMSPWYWLRFAFSFYGLPFLVYLFVQLGAGYTLRGRRRLFALLPAPFMLALLVLSIVAIRQQSTLWWLPLNIVSPIAALLIGIVWAFGWRSATRPRASLVAACGGIGMTLGVWLSMLVRNGALLIPAGGAVAAALALWLAPRPRP